MVGGERAISSLKEVLGDDGSVTYVYRVLEQCEARVVLIIGKVR